MTDTMDRTNAAQAPAAASGAFPTVRPRRLRRTAGLRNLIRETTLTPTDFIEPFFVVEGHDVRAPIASMPGVAQLSGFVDTVLGSFTGPGGVSALGYAQLVQVLPVSLFGASFAAASLPAST